METKVLRSKIEMYPIIPRIQRSCVCMLQHLFLNDMVGFEVIVNYEDITEEVLWYECLHNRNSKNFKDKNKIEKPIVVKSRQNCKISHSSRLIFFRV